MSAPEQPPGAPRLFKWFDRPLIAASGRPEGREQFEFLTGQGIRWVVNVTRTPDDEAVLAELGIAQVHTPDLFRGPAALDAAAAAIAQAVDRQEPVLVH